MPKGSFVSFSGLTAQLPRELSAAMFASDLPRIQRSLCQAIEADPRNRQRILDIYAWCIAHTASRLYATPENEALRVSAMGFGLDLGANIHFVHGALSLLAQSAEGGSRALVELLLDRGADINGPATSHTPLSRAIVHYDRPLVAWLLAQGADPNARDMEGLPIAFHAMVGQCQLLLPMLHDAGADFQARGKVGSTLIHAWVAACRSTRKGMILRDHRTLQKLVDWGVDPARPDDAGITPQDEALRFGQLEEARAIAAQQARWQASRLNAQTTASPTRQSRPARL